MGPSMIPKWEKSFTWHAELTASMTHFSKHFDTLSSEPAASQAVLQKAEIDHDEHAEQRWGEGQGK